MAASTARAARDARAWRASPAPVIDGRLDDPAWQRAQPSGDFLERRPSPGAVPPVDSWMKILYDDDAIYFGLRLGERPGDQVRAMRLLRDAPDFFLDDSVVVKLDVERDRRTTLAFGVTARNTQADFVVLDNGKRDEMGLDLVWQSATQVGDGEWTAELRLPLASLGVGGEQGQHVMGLQVTHNHAARPGQYEWTYVPPEYGGFAASHYGELVGIEVARTGDPVSLIPYLVAGTRGQRWFGSERPVMGGGDLLVRLGTASWMHLSALTDFAEADLDDPVVNLDRFPLFQPEKRPFFLRGLDLFDFGEPGSAQPYFSRRIGLDDSGETLPMLGGGKLFHRGEHGAVGVLDVVTGAPLTNWSVSRVEVDVAGALSVGGMVTTRHTEEEPSALTIGLDTRGEPGRVTFAAAWAASAPAGETVADRSMGSLALSWRGQHVQPVASALVIQSGFDPEVGFVRRPGIARTSLEVPVTSYTHSLGLERIRVAAFGELTGTDELDQTLGRRALGSLGLASSEWTIDLTAGAAEDVVENEFELVPGILIAPGTYAGPATSARIGRSGVRNPSGWLRYAGNLGYFGGQLHTIGAGIDVSPADRLRIAASGEASRVAIDLAEPFWIRLAKASLLVALTDRLQADATAQLVDTPASLMLQARLRYRFHAAGDVFLAWAYREPDGEPASHELVGKLRYQFDFLF